MSPEAACPHPEEFSALLDRQALRVMYDYRFAPGDGGRSRVPVRFSLQ